MYSSNGFMKKVYSLINHAKHLPVVSLVINPDRKNQLLIELADGSKFRIDICRYDESV